MNERTDDAVWQMIEKEKKKDLFIKRISKIAWAVTLIMLGVLLIFWGMELSRTLGLYKAGAVSYATVTAVMYTMVRVIGIFAFIIAIISTIGVFIRIRTTSLMEIQQRLANLEQMIINKP